MTTSELQAIYSAIETINKANSRLMWWKSQPVPLEEAMAMAFSELQQYAFQSLDELTHIRNIVEAHLASGLPFPPRALEFAELLAASQPEWLRNLPEEKANMWRKEAQAIIATIDPKISNNSNMPPTKKESAKPKEPITLDPDKFAHVFLASFTKKDPKSGINRFDVFFDKFSSCSKSFTTTDFCRVAYQIQQSREVTKRIKYLPFTKWLDEFCSLCNITPPRCKDGNKYANPKGADLSPFL